MAMLAERRVRKRYNLVPRGKALYEDGSRFGTRMLEKMGWEKGKGLGANEDGKTDFVRVRTKHDNEGLGFEDRNDQWTQHENSFDSLLKTLNNGGEDNPYEGDVAGEDIPAAMGFGFHKDSKPLAKMSLSGESLEEKSKNSRARVHYMKFTRGKDISRYSEKDLANIFGRKSLVKENSDAKDDSDVKTSKECSQTASDGEEETKQPTFGTTTICRGISISDYFKAKMSAVRKSKLNGNQSCDENADMEAIEEHGTGDVLNNDEYTVEKSKRKSKKRKHQELEVEAMNIENSVTENNSSLEAACNGTGEDAVNYKKKKRKIIPENEAVMDLTENKSCDGQTIDAQPMTSKKSKRKEKTRVESDEKQIGQDQTEPKYVHEETQTKSEKKSKQVALDNIEDKGKFVDENVENLTVETCENTVKKSKRRKKNVDTCEMTGKEEIESLSVPEIRNPKDLASTTDNNSSGTKKRKKTSIETCDLDAKTSSLISESIPIEEETPKKKKKSKKSVEFDPLEDVTIVETKKSKKSKKNKSDLESNAQFLPSETDGSDVTGSNCKTKKSKNSKKSKSEDSDDTSGKKLIEFEHKIELGGDSTENIAQSGNTSILKLPTDSLLSGQEPVVVAPTAITTTTVSNEFKFPELNRRKRKKKPKQNAQLDAVPTEEPTPCESIAIAPPEEESDYKLSCFAAEKFYNVNIDGFPGSNFPFINGYGLSGRLKLEISRRQGDELKILKFYGNEFGNLRQAENRERIKQGLKPKLVEKTFFPANLV